MSVENKNLIKQSISKALKELFRDGWKSILIIDAIHHQEVTYQDFLGLVLNYKKKISALGLKKDDVICLLIKNSLDLVLFYFAALFLGLIVVPIDPHKGELAIREILSNINYKFIFTDLSKISFLTQWKDIKDIKDNFLTNQNTNLNDLDFFDDIDFRKPFLISFTSGSTGIPKGVIHSFENLFKSALAFKNRFNFDKSSIFYHNLPMTYMAGILNLIILPLICGSRIVIGERFNVSNILSFWDIPIKYSVNTFWFPPSILSLLTKLDRGTKGKEYINQVRKNFTVTGCVGTAPLNKKVKDNFELKYDLPLYESYGLTETLFVSTNDPKITYQEKSVGRLLESVNIDFAEDGEILIQAPWMFLGYWNLESSSCFQDGKYKTGDLGSIISEEFLCITGRKKDLIIRGGINISPITIENFLNNLGIFEEHSILGIEDLNRGEKIVCCYVSSSQVFSKEEKNNINQQIIQKLGKDYQIDEFALFDSIPRNENGKVDKFKIREIYQNQDSSNIYS